MSDVPDGRLLAQGGSQSWDNQKAWFVTVWDAFAADRKKASADACDVALGEPWDKISAAVLCSNVVYEKWANWLLHEYKKKDGNHYKIGTIRNMIGMAINRASDKFMASNPSAATRNCFGCLTQPGSRHQIWLRNLKKRALRVWFQRAMKNGEQIDGSCLPLVLEHVQDMVKAYEMKVRHASLRVALAARLRVALHHTVRLRDALWRFGSLHARPPPPLTHLCARIPPLCRARPLP